MEKIRRNFKNIGSITKAFSIIGIVAGVLMGVIGLLFHIIINNLEPIEEDPGMAIGLLILMYAFLLFLAALRYVGLIVLALSIIFLLVGIRCKKYSEYGIKELKSETKIIILMCIPYFLCATILLILDVLWIIDNGPIGIVFILVPTIIFAVGGISLLINRKNILKSSEEEKIKIIY